QIRAIMKISVLFPLFLLLSSNITYTEVDTLTNLSKVIGGAGWEVEFKDGRLYAGCGASLLVYEAADPSIDSVIAHRNFTSLINDIVITEGKIIFIAANHDGLYALDGNDLDLPIMAYYPMPDAQHSAMDIEFIPPDTLWVATYQGMVKLLFGGDCFIEVSIYFEEIKVLGTGSRDSLLAVAIRQGSGIFATGGIRLFSTSRGELNFITEYIASSLMLVEDARFADLRDDIIYVCGGSVSGLGFQGLFIALQYDTSGLNQVGRYTISGVPLQPPHIQNMDSRNDTLFLAVNAGTDLDGTFCPVLDGTCLPDSLPLIDKLRTIGLFFDVSLHDRLPAIAVAAEWFGIAWGDLTRLGSIWGAVDTIAMHPTGGWGKRCSIQNDTLWLCWEGYGAGIFDVSDLSNPVQIGRIKQHFTSDLVRIDTLVFLGCYTNNVQIFNIAPWYRGGIPVPIGIYNPGDGYTDCLTLLYTDLGPRIAIDGDGGIFPTAANQGVFLIDPEEAPDCSTKGHLFSGRIPIEMLSFGDTLITLFDDSVIIVKVFSDSAIRITETGIPGNGKDIYRERNFIAVACGSEGAQLYQYECDSMSLIGGWEEETCVGVGYQDTLLYACCRNKGLFVLDIWSPGLPEVVAWFPGSGGWEMLAGGVSDISFDEDGNIFLIDFHASCFILDAYERNPVGMTEKLSTVDKHHLTCYPNPFNCSTTITVAFKCSASSPLNSNGPNTGLVQCDIRIYNINGRWVSSENTDVMEKTTNSIECYAAPNKHPAKTVNPRNIDNPYAVKVNYSWQPDPSLPSGIYFIKATRGEDFIVKRVVYLK
ncbi:hypothetical protein JW877_00815, partial [bacterium]|nr:hypothetical protein [bacterium]